MGLYVSTAAVQSREWVKGFFTSFRTQFGDGWPTLYDSYRTPVTVDILEAGFIYATLCIAFSFLIILPGIRGREKLFISFRFAYSLFVFTVIMLSLFGQEWEFHSIHTKTQYKAGIAKEIEAEIGIKIGLHSVNITLKGTPEKQVNETINYNERFYWSNPWGQGRIGFGPYASEINQEYRAAQYKGLPYPILWIAEYFTFDGEGVRFGRHYRHAGFFAHIMIWTAFGLWILTNMLFFMVVRYGAYFMTLTGTCMIVANIIFASIRNVSELSIPFEDANLAPKYGWCFYLNLITGIACLLFGMVVVFMDLRFNAEICTFFGVDVLQDTEEFYADPSTLGIKPRQEPVRAPSYKKRPDDSSVGNDDNDIYENEDIPPPSEQSTKPLFRKRTTGLSYFAAKSERKPRPKTRTHYPNAIVEEDDEELYMNVPTTSKDVYLELQQQH